MDNEQTQSPSPTQIPVQSEVVKYNFFDALKQVLDGKKITKLEWKDQAAYGYLKEVILTLHKADSTDHNWIISEGDLIGDDWIVL